MNELALFAGAGGGILGGKLLGWRTVCAVENEPAARDILVARQNDGCLDPFPIWDDVCTFDGKAWKGRVDVVSGGFPCQDISTARGKGAKGIDGEKSSLWWEMLRVIREIEPIWVFMENSHALTFRGLDRILKEVASLGYDASWGVFSAGDVGARHKRERIWIVGNRRDSLKESTAEEPEIYEQIKIPNRALSEGFPAKPGMGRISDGLACWLDRLQALGNGQVPQVAAHAFKILSKTL